MSLFTRKHYDFLVKNILRYKITKEERRTIFHVLAVIFDRHCGNFNTEKWNDATREK